MQNRYLALVITLAILWGTAARAELVVRADRAQLSLDETLTITITKEGRGSIDDAALQPLATDFQILGRSQSSSTQIINGSMSSSFALTLELAPKRAGVLVIPALVSGADTSKPLTIRVDSQPQPRTRADNDRIFLESEVDTHTVSVQAQVLYTLRIYWAVEADINEPEAPPLRDALLEKLDDAKYTKVINGRTYRVFARRYAIFPQKSGVLEIPPALVQGVVAGRQRSDAFSGFFGPTGEEFRLRGKAERVTVREKAPEYPAGAAWLPTQKLTVASNWSRDLNTLAVGEPVTLTIGLAAPGLLGAQLPAVALPNVEGVKIYQDKAQVDNLKKDGGITGVRKESIALVPTRPGSIQLPEVRIPWWDKERQQVAYAVLPARRLLIQGGQLAASPGAGIVNPPPLTAPAAPAAPEVSGAAPDLAAAPPNPGPGWAVILLGVGGALLLGGWLVTLYLLFQARRQLVAQAETQRQVDAATILREREAFTVLAQACRENDSARARLAVLAWGKSRFPRAAARTGADLERLFPGAGLAEQLAEIDRAIYGQGQNSWRGTELLAMVEKIRQGKNAAAGNVSVLPPLYR
ncbi:MAG: protein BatD [Desulfobulbaceae bacterium]|nr:protein BatD [Desulfobulbaceae bacterium]